MRLCLSPPESLVCALAFFLMTLRWPLCETWRCHWHRRQRTSSPLKSRAVRSLSLQGRPNHWYRSPAKSLSLIRFVDLLRNEISIDFSETNAKHVLEINFKVFFKHLITSWGNAVSRLWQLAKCSTFNSAVLRAQQINVRVQSTQIMCSSAGYQIGWCRIRLFFSQLRRATYTPTPTHTHSCTGTTEPVKNINWHQVMPYVGTPMWVFCESGCVSL